MNGLYIKPDGISFSINSTIGFRFDEVKVSYAAYADDVTFFASNREGLQALALLHLFELTARSV